MGRLFGAERFVVYNMTACPAISPYIEHYVSAGLMDVHIWRPPVNYENSLRYEAKTGGQLSMINDCVYRYMYRTKHLVLVNLDEIIVPRKHNTWAEMLNASRCHNQPEANVRNVFFPKANQNRTIISKNKLYSKLVTVSHNIRQSDIAECRVLAKSIIRPSAVYLVAVHTVMKSSGKYCCLEDDLGLMHHYKKGWQGPSTTTYVQDTFMDKFAERIAVAVDEVMQTVKKSVSN